MHHDKKHVSTLFLCFALFLFTSIAHATPEITDERATAAYWTQRNVQGDVPFLNAEQIAAVNTAIRAKDSTITDLRALPTEMTGAEVHARIIAARSDGGYGEATTPEVYENGAPLSASTYQNARANCNLQALTSTVSLRYGVVLRRANLRILPHEAGWFESPNDVHYDDLQATALDPAEPLAVLWNSADGRFSFVICRNYAGWLARADFVETNREMWMTYVQPETFAVVLANKKSVTLPNGESVLLQMGTKIPATENGGQMELTLPMQQQNTLVLAKITVPADDSIRMGFLPCTENNFIRQGFRFLGDVYGWGGMDDSVDCSAFVGDVYRSMGIELPRDADHQARALPKVAWLSGNYNQRLATLETFPSGALLANATHIMLYLGEDANGTPMVLQAMSSYFTFENGQRQKHYLRKVIASTVDFPNVNDVPYLDGVQVLGALR